MREDGRPGSRLGLVVGALVPVDTDVPWDPVKSKGGGREGGRKGWVRIPKVESEEGEEEIRGKETLNQKSRQVTTTPVLILVHHLYHHRIVRRKSRGPPLMYGGPI